VVQEEFDYTGAPTFTSWAIYVKIPEDHYLHGEKDYDKIVNKIKAITSSRIFSSNL
jgi:hypothetical protein